MRLTVVGNGYVGTVTATCLSWLGHDVVGLEANPGLAERLNAGDPPFYEPGLSSLLAETLATGRLRFTSSAPEALRDARLVFLCVGTPGGPSGAPDLSFVEAAVRTVVAAIPRDAVLAVKSTVPVGTGDRIRFLRAEVEGTSERGSVASNPEFLREGAAIQDFLFPDRIVIGGEAVEVEVLADAYAPILAQDFPGGDPAARPDLFVTDVRSAELIKYASNAFLAMKISFANEVANVCERVGADARLVLPAVGADPRIGPEFLSPGLGWGGSCFPKDVAAMVALAEECGYESRLLPAAVDVNLEQQARVVGKLERELDALLGRRVALFGLSFKPGTDDLRSSPALELARRLVAAGTTVCAYDPVVKELPGEAAGVQVARDPYEAARGADAVVLATEWPEFLALDLPALASEMSGRLVLDARNALDPTRVEEAGLSLVGVGWSPRSVGSRSYA